MLALFAVAGRATGTGTAALYTLLGGAALVGATCAVIGWFRGWHRRRGLLIVWPIAALVSTALTGLVDPDVTRDLPGTITIAFAYVGLTCRRWRSILLVPLGVAAYVVGGAKHLPADLPVVVVTAMMWVLVAEVPAWLIARLQYQSELLRTVAQTDALTQLLNRSTLAAELSRHAGESAVVLIDLNNFKQYNDSQGHEAGDRLLVDFAAALRASVRDGDVPFRIGGDEFLVILAGADERGAERFVEALGRRWSAVASPVSFSAGISFGEQNPFPTADRRMYDDKRSRSGEDH